MDVCADRFLEEWVGAEVVVPDLIGCGESEPWEPSERGLFVPLDWARALEELWRREIRRPCVVLAQGGLAPLAVMLAARESDDWRGHQAIAAIVLASPPEWSTLANGLDDGEVVRNFELLSASIGSPSPLGTLCYRTLCARPFVRFFSAAFLFADTANTEFDRFLEACLAQARPERRWPVIAFNAGLVGLRGLEAELTSLPQPTLVLAGESGGKPKADDGRDFAERMRECTVRQLPGRNVLPWESASATCAALGDFVAAVPAVALPVAADGVGE